MANTWQLGEPCNWKAADEINMGRNRSLISRQKEEKIRGMQEDNEGQKIGEWED